VRATGNERFVGRFSLERDDEVSGRVEGHQQVFLLGNACQEAKRLCFGWSIACAGDTHAIEGGVAKPLEEVVCDLADRVLAAGQRVHDTLHGLPRRRRRESDSSCIAALRPSTRDVWPGNRSGVRSRWNRMLAPSTVSWRAN
jgi:hypothetical protein